MLYIGYLGGQTYVACVALIDLLSISVFVSFMLIVKYKYLMMFENASTKIGLQLGSSHLWCCLVV